MKTLKDIIVRKRPQPTTDIVRKRPLPSAVDHNDVLETLQASQSSELDAVRARLQRREGAREQTLERPAELPQDNAIDPTDLTTNPAQIKQIWDIEEEDREDDAPPRPQREVRGEPASAPTGGLSASRAWTELDRAVSADPDLSGKNRVKTRIIGFHTGGAETDVFGAERAAPSAQALFPAGWLVVVDGPGRGASFTICAGVSTIGRGADQTVCLDFGDTSISRANHASIAYDEEQNQFFVGHGGKSNIVRRNGNPVLATEDLADADLIRIGKTTLRFVALCGAEFTWGSMEDGHEADARES